MVPYNNNNLRMASDRDSTVAGLRMSCDGLVRRLVRLPLNIIEGISRAISRGDLSRSPRILPPLEPIEGGLLLIPEEWFFLTEFEREFGSSHPFFYVRRFAEVLKIARDESKLLFVFLHAPEHPDTAPFCRGTLCSALAVEFLDANFVSWGAVTSRGEGRLMATALRASSFPFCAVVAPASDDSISVLRQVEGPVSPEELVEILRRTIEEQGSAFRASREQEEETIRANRKLREEQDAAYRASLQMDKEKDMIRDVLVEDGVPAAAQRRRRANNERHRKIPAPKQPIEKTREASNRTLQKEAVVSRKTQPITKILIRFPNGMRKEQSFLNTDTIRSIYKYIDSLDLSGIGSYRLISNFPRKVFGYEQLETTLVDAGLHQSAALFLELLQ